MIKSNCANSRVLACYSLSMLASALPAALFFFYVRDVLGAEGYLLHFLALYVGAGIVALPLWKRAAQRYGTGEVWLAAMIFTIIIFIGVCFLENGDIVPYGIICVLSGLTFGAEFMLPAMMLKNNTMSRYATLAFLGKVMAILGCAPLLLFTDFFNLSTTQLHSVLIALYGVVPCLIKIAAAFLLWQWINMNGGNNETFNTRGSSHAA
jgi:glycoside/pentoside/hexuronide:cation symporter, GPH family